MGERLSGLPGKLAIAAGSSLLALGLAEGLLRFVDLGPFSRVPAPNHVDPELRVHRIEADPAIGWSLQPGASGDIGGVSVRVNNLGCRGPEPAGGVVLSLGDSIAFGAGVPEDALFATRLSAVLLEGGVDASVLSCGVSGYNLRQTIARYDRDFAGLRPAAVLLSLFSDDLFPQYRMRDRSVIAELRPRFALVRACEWAVAAFRGTAMALPWAIDPDEEKRLAITAFEAFVAARQAEGVPLLALLHPMLEPLLDNPGGNTSIELEALARRLGVETVRLEDVYRAEVGRELPRLSINPATRDPHPGGDGQRMIGDAVAPWLRAALRAK